LPKKEILMAYISSSKTILKSKLPKKEIFNGTHMADNTTEQVIFSVNWFAN
jgi:hypothetical protein